MLPDTNGSSGQDIVTRGRELLSTWRETLTGGVRDGTDPGRSTASADEPAVAGPVPEPVDGETSGGARGGAVAVDGTATSPDDPPAERIKREAYIEELLDENSGCLWQREIVSRTDVSSSTISRWLSAMENEDRIVRIRIGREKFVALPDAEIEAAAAPAPFQRIEE